MAAECRHPRAANTADPRGDENAVVLGTRWLPVQVTSDGTAAHFRCSLAMGGDLVYPSGQVRYARACGIWRTSCGADRAAMAVLAAGGDLRRRSVRLASGLRSSKRWPASSAGLLIERAKTADVCGATFSRPCVRGQKWGCDINGIHVAAISRSFVWRRRRWAKPRSRGQVVFELFSSTPRRSRGRFASKFSSVLSRPSRPVSFSADRSRSVEALIEIDLLRQASTILRPRQQHRDPDRRLRPAQSLSRHRGRYGDACAEDVDRSPRAPASSAVGSPQGLQRDLPSSLFRRPVASAVEPPLYTDLLAASSRSPAITAGALPGGRDIVAVKLIAVSFRHRTVLAIACAIRCSVLAGRVDVAVAYVFDHADDYIEMLIREGVDAAGRPRRGTMISAARRIGPRSRHGRGVQGEIDGRRRAPAAAQGRGTRYSRRSANGQRRLRARAIAVSSPTTSAPSPGPRSSTNRGRRLLTQRAFPVRRAESAAKCVDRPARGPGAVCNAERR
ncbi:MAG: hypothetical protein U5O16_22230 [Rhodococcus sp. (in: high G+C Gram-positive bacteria)]|uniref:hypothetical protein n=1 Tax=Rhodococcus sp. TaxID=1831 RepID=UPI002AD856D2|nr:hypothetical protein [Rhodococcus sp. (in: high G+C Gram-positive bacteria)]